MPYKFNPFTGNFDLVNPSEAEFDGGFANSVFLTAQLFDGGDANG